MKIGVLVEEAGRIECPGCGRPVIFDIDVDNSWRGYDYYSVSAKHRGIRIARWSFNQEANDVPVEEIAQGFMDRLNNSDDGRCESVWATMSVTK